MNEVSLGQSIVGFLHLNKVITVKLDRDAHPHMLGAFYCHTIYPEKVTTLQSLEPEIIKHEVTIVTNHFLVLVGILANHIMIVIRDNLCLSMVKLLYTFQQSWGSRLVVIINHNTRRKLTVIGMILGLHHSTRFRGKFIKLGCRHTVCKLITDLLGNQVWIDMLQSVR